VTPERLSQIEALYHAVRECEPGEHTAFLAAPAMAMKTFGVKWNRCSPQTSLVLVSWTSR
jgi:hypothetical protein